MPTLENLINDYEVQSSNVTSLVANNMLVNHFVRGLLNGHEQKIGIDSSIDISSTDLPFSSDIDSVIYLSYTDIPFKNVNWQLYFRPNYTFSVRKTLGINYSYSSTERYGSGSISSCPNFPFLRHDYTNVSLL